MLKVENASYLLQLAIKLSGPFKENGGRLYSSYHLPKLEYLDAQRNTLARTRMFGIEDTERFLDESVLDLGSNTGAMSFEFAKRGAKVVGLEYNRDRVGLCEKIASYLKLDVSFKFQDLNNFLILPRFDIVLAMAIDHYIKDKERFYRFIVNHMNDKCFYESNDIHFDINKFNTVMREEGACVNYLGTSQHVTDSSKGKPRKLFVLCRKYPYLRGKIVKQGKYYIKTYYSEDEWNKIKAIYQNIKEIKQVPLMDFSRYKQIITPDVGDNLAEIILTDEEKTVYRQQLIEFVFRLNAKGYAHRDLNVKNILVKDGNLFVVDWDYVAENRVPFLKSYDLTGQGLESPALSNNTNIFKSFPRKILKSIAETLGVNWEYIKNFS